MASLSLDNSEVVRATLQTMGLGRDAANLDAATEADLRAVLRSGLRRFFFPVVNGQFVYQWRFLETFFPISVTANFDDGTIEVAAGTVTLTGGVWPSYADGMFIRVSGHTLFITERTDDTHVEVSNTQLAVDAGAEYTALRYQYDLPADFGEWIGGVVYANGNENRLLAGTSESEIRLRYAVGQGENSRTTHYVVIPAPADGTPRIMVWPVPEPDAFIQGTYVAVPDDNLPADLTTPGSIVQVKPVYATAVIEAILAEAEAYNNNEINVHEQKFQAALRAAIAHDKAIGGEYSFSNRAVTRDPLGHGTVLPITFETID